MSLSIRGTQPLAWGTQAITGYICEDSSEEPTTGEYVIRDENNHVITQITGHDEKTEYNVNVIPKSSITTPPKPGEVFSISSEIKFVILGMPKKRQIGEVEKWNIKGVSYPGISLSS